MARPVRYGSDKTGAGAVAGGRETRKTYGTDPQDAIHIAVDKREAWRAWMEQSTE